MEGANLAVGFFAIYNELDTGEGPRLGGLLLVLSGNYTVVLFVKLHRQLSGGVFVDLLVTHI